MPGVTPAEVLSNFGITLVEDPAENQPRLLVDLPAAELVEHAIRREEGRMASNGALVIETGERTGRSPNDRFIVDTPDVHDKIAWGAVNRPLSVESYEAIKAGIVDYLNERDVFVTRGMAGADRNHTRRLLVACERASQALFIKQMLARPLAIMVKLMTPLLWVTSMITRLVSPPPAGPVISEDDIRAVTSLSRQAGRIKPYEEAFIRNVLALDQKRVREIMTPRTVVFELSDELTVEQAYTDPRTWHFSRIPVYGDHNEDIVGVIERRTLGRCMNDGRKDVPISKIMQPAHFILENQTLDVLLHDLLKARVHLFVVMDEYGGLSGVVSLEDVLEEILGSEIVDESDKVDDLRALARQRRRELSGNRQG